MKLATGAKKRITTAFRPKTHKCYQMLYRTFIAFCVYLDLSIFDVSVVHIISYLEYLAQNGLSANMLANHVSAGKANFTMHGLDYSIWEHPNVRYFIKSIKINRPIKVTKKNIIDLPTLLNIVTQCDSLYMGKIFKAVFLLAFFGFLRLFNIAPHSLSTFDPSRHLTAGDLIFTKKFLKVVIKWSKTIQTRDRVYVLSLPRIPGSNLCPHRACRAALKLYSPANNDPLFQFPVADKWQVLTDTRIRKCLSKIYSKMGYTSNHYTFHSFRRSGATLAYNSHVPLQTIKSHGSWSPDCVWTYIQKDHKSG